MPQTTTHISANGASSTRSRRVTRVPPSVKACVNWSAAHKTGPSELFNTSETAGADCAKAPPAKAVPSRNSLRRMEGGKLISTR